jgi:D-glycero-alpha-D-manno-heptose-7-phosphate kinase
MMSRVDEHGTPLQIVNAVAPIRICDNGGWTDTWFAGHGKIFNIGVHPCVEVQVRVHPLGALPEQIVLEAENYGDHYMFKSGDLPGRHPLLEATIDEIGVPTDASIDISIFSEAPAGGSTGTSAAVTVALIGALDALTSGRLTPQQIASTAHHIEVDRLGMESGIQDQLCAAFGGINYIEMPAYPRASVSQLAVSDAVWWELDRRLVLVHLGRGHVSSEVHDRVIARLEREGESSSYLETLRRTAELARDAVLAADLAGLGRAMSQNTDAQENLHASLVSQGARLAIEVAVAHGAWGWKLNGAGGDGGSITILCGPDMSVKRRMIDALGDADPRFEVIPTHLSRHGVRIWHS